MWHESEKYTYLTWTKIGKTQLAWKYLCKWCKCHENPCENKLWRQTQIIM